MYSIYSFMDCPSNHIHIDTTCYISSEITYYYSTIYAIVLSHDKCLPLSNGLTIIIISIGKVQF